MFLGRGRLKERKNCFYRAPEHGKLTGRGNILHASKEAMPYKRRTAMHKTVVAGLIGVIMTVAVKGAAQGAGSPTLGVPAAETKTITSGWSAKKQVLEKDVYNDQNEKVGEVEDIIITPAKSVSYAIVGVGGFLGLGEHYVAIPFKQLKAGDNKFVLADATKEKLKALPKFEYTK
jgi:sporulation protein YlmC with PRC-barrel domain